MAARTATTVERDRSIDVFRGLLVVLLVFVEYLPPSPAHSWLRHSPWDGVRIADFVFPGFLFVVGASMAASQPAPLGRAARRAAMLVILGLFFNAWTELDPLRFTGVLQTIGISGFLAWLVTRRVQRTDDLALVAGALLAVHGAVLGRAFEIDRWLVPDAHLYHEGALGHDPEGILATVLGGTALVLLGFAAARLRAWWLPLALAAVTAVAWLAWEPNKRAWTPTFTLLMAATGAAVLLALRYLPVPLLGRIGRNALLVYVGQHVVREVIGERPFEGMDDLHYAFAAAVVWSAAAIALLRIGIRLRV